METLLSAEEPFVVFAQSVDTVYEVKRYVESQGIVCCLIVGGQEPGERRRIIDQFTNSDRLGRRVLVSSSAGGEGINLQIARRLIHFDLPWNPMVLEQRIGRVHRIGTVDTVVVDTILLRNSREAEIYSRLMERLLMIVTDLTDDEGQRDQLFRRIMAGIPLENLRELFGGAVGDANVAIGRAVDEGKAHVERVDAELREHRVAVLPEDRGRATMEHLIELLERSGGVERTGGSVEYRKVVFDEESQEFRATRNSAIRFEPRDGRRRRPEGWLVFDREAATLAPEVARANSGGIDHPIVGVALRSIRTPESVEDMRSLAVGVGVFDREYLELLSDGEEPVVILSYVTARLDGDYYLDHELHLYAVAASNPTVEELGRKDGELVEQMVWDNLRYEGSRVACPMLSPTLTARLVEEDARIREELCENRREESGRWVGAVWPVAATVLVPT